MRGFAISDVLGHDVRRIDVRRVSDACHFALAGDVAPAAYTQNLGWLGRTTGWFE
jgi:hypothetical protein